MAKLRKASCYRKLTVPFTRKSKKREKSYVKSRPYSKIVSFDMGNRKKAEEFPVLIKLISRNNANIRHNALEASRIAVNKVLATKIGVSNYYFKIKPYPHHILRENPLAAGAGADRMSTGMKHSFGKVIGVAARVKEGQELMYVATTKKNIQAAKKAINLARYKFPVKARIVVEERIAK